MSIHSFSPTLSQTFFCCGPLLASKNNHGSPYPSSRKYRVLVAARQSIHTQNHIIVIQKAACFASTRQPSSVFYYNTSTLYFSLHILYYDQQMHNYFTNYHTPTCFDTFVSSSGSLKSIPCQVTPVFQTQLLTIQFTINTLRTGSFKLFKRPFPGFLTILTL